MRILQVVVANEAVGSQLLSKGRLTQRVTIIPLNKIDPYTVSSDVGQRHSYASLPDVCCLQRLNTVKNISRGKANLALQLIGYPEEVAKAMSYVFGSTLICDDADTAKTVAFHPQIKLKSVTVQGDVYNPSGTLEGGSAPNSNQILIRLQELQGLETELAARQTELQAIEKRWQGLQAGINKMKQARSAYDIQLHEVRELEARVSDSNSSRVSLTRLLFRATHRSNWQIVAEVEAIKQKIAEITQNSAEAKTKENQLKADCKRIEKEIDEFKNNRDSKLKELKVGQIIAACDDC